MASLTSQPPVPRRPAPSTGTPQTPTLIWDVCLPQSRSIPPLKRYPHLCLLVDAHERYIYASLGFRSMTRMIADELPTLTCDDRPSQYLSPAHTPSLLAVGLFLRRASALLPPQRSVLMRAHVLARWIRSRMWDVQHICPSSWPCDVPLRHSGWDLSSPRSSRWRSISPVRHLTPASPALGAQLHASAASRHTQWRNPRGSMKTRMQIESGRTRIDARHATPRRLTLTAPVFSDMQNLYAGLQRSFLVLPTIRVCPWMELSSNVTRACCGTENCM
ncbi:hypothetical protein B0H13DRAFT_2338708 [Mycena leptocephala]|nr:hypothetical protein B0H13DRAFT_2338708 [Mycena leptocephala]